jgi:hypothetical protein
VAIASGSDVFSTYAAAPQSKAASMTLRSSVPDRTITVSSGELSRPPEMIPSAASRPSARSISITSRSGRCSSRSASAVRVVVAAPTRSMLKRPSSVASAV